jgi:hypothetical protein
LSVDYKAVRSAATRAIDEFAHNRVFSALDAGTWTVRQYRQLLLTLFYQVYQGSMSFAAAASNCPPRLTELREYMVAHAHEEIPHYQWILSDLYSTGYGGPDPKDLLPHPASLAYVSFNVNNALHMPGTRLASSIVLEGIGQRYGAWFGQQVLAKTPLKKENLSFFFAHGETDKKHIAELWDIIERSPLTSDERRWMAHASYVAGTFYRRMWDESIDCIEY